MDSINKNQPEDNHEDLFAEESIKKIQELVERATVCFFCTKLHKGKSFQTRPMAVQKTDDKGVLWFLSASDSHKNKEIKEDPKVQLLFQGPHLSEFLNIYGSASVSTDKNKIKELWSPMLKTWFTEGENDPRITVIKMVPEEGYYWDTKNNILVGFVKRLVGAAIGKTLDDSIEGKIKV